jgi:hypothetical protein
MRIKVKGKDRGRAVLLGCLLGAAHAWLRELRGLKEELG